MWYRFWTFIVHFLSAWNTTGEGIHSPSLFYLVRFLMRDEYAYYGWSAIEKKRALLLACEDELEVVDYGSGGSKEGMKVSRRVCDIAKGHLETRQMGELLFRLALHLGHEAGRPIEILELGTSLGITTAYLASADSRNRVMTLEGSAAIAKVAQGVWRQLILENIECVVGNIDDTLYKCAREKLDLVFVDANHTYEATMRYVNFLLPRMQENGILIVDDIYHSPQMTLAWEAIKADERVTSTMDIWHAGLVFVAPHYLKKHFRIRV
ncbi:MAG: class I SAM-dependent methyltransferase [Paludibacteraceae bacterium]|nr:class I SAM-dependent methyltransferase [Paludibacteraceae bacterium]